MRHQLICAIGLILALGNGIQAGQGVVRRVEPPRQGPDVERSAVNLSAGWRPAGSDNATRVIGSVIDIQRVPVPYAKVQLRNLNTGGIEQTAESDDAGDYAFEVEDPGTFVVEMVHLDGQIVALSNAGTLSRFETLQTIVQLPGRWDGARRLMTMPQDITSFFGMSAETTMTAATLALAAESNITPSNPGVPVSP